MQGKNFHLDSHVNVEGVENVKLQLKLAGMGSRMLAFMLDLLIQIVIMMAAYLTYFAIAVPIGFLDIYFEVYLFDYLIAPSFFIIIFIVIWGYFIIFELTWKGQTPGKKCLGIKVVQDNGSPINFISSFLRNILRIADAFPFIPAPYAAGLISIFVSANEKRLGDMVAGTVVVKVPSDGRPAVIHEILPEREGISDAGSLLAKKIHKLTANDIDLLRDFIERRVTLGQERSAVLGRQLAGAMAVRMGLSTPEDPERFLLEVASALAKSRQV